MATKKAKKAKAKDASLTPVGLALNFISKLEQQGRRIARYSGAWWQREECRWVELPHAVAGRRKLAGFCPMMVLRRDGKPWLAIGTPGGHTIVQTVPQMVMNTVDFRLDVQQAIAAPRLSFDEPEVIVVDEGVPESVRKALKALGHDVQVRRLGNAHGLAITYDKSGNPERFTGGADPRGEGAAMGR